MPRSIWHEVVDRGESRTIDIDDFVDPDGTIWRGPDGRGRPHEELEDMSRSELYEQAQRAGTPGRSKMSRRELVEALEAEAP